MNLKEPTQDIDEVINAYAKAQQEKEAMPHSDAVPGSDSATPPASLERRGLLTFHLEALSREERRGGDAIVRFEASLRFFDKPEPAIWKGMPGASLEIHITEPDYARLFVPGKHYRVTIDEAT